MSTEQHTLADMPFWETFKNRWGWDELYHDLFIRPVVWFSREVVPTLIDRQVIDGVLQNQDGVISVRADRVAPLRVTQASASAGWSGGYPRFFTFPSRSR